MNATVEFESEETMNATLDGLHVDVVFEDGDHASGMWKAIRPSPNSGATMFDVNDAVIDGSPSSTLVRSFVESVAAVRVLDLPTAPEHPSAEHGTGGVVS